MSIIIRLQNLPLEANSLDIRRFFQGLRIPDGGVHIVGGENGDAFIAFGGDEDARQAMERDGNLIKNSRIKLLLSSRNEMQRVIDNARSQTLGLMNPAQAAGPAKPPSMPVNGPGPQQAPIHGAPFQGHPGGGGQYAQQQQTVPQNSVQNLHPKPMNSGPSSYGGQMYPGPPQGPPPPPTAAVAPMGPSSGYGMAPQHQQLPPKGPSAPNDPFQRQPPPFRSRSRSRSPPPPRVTRDLPGDPMVSQGSSMQSGLMGSLQQMPLQASQQQPPPQQPPPQPFGQNGSYQANNGTNGGPMSHQPPQPGGPFDNNGNYYSRPQQFPQSGAPVDGPKYGGDNGMDNRWQYGQGPPGNTGQPPSMMGPGGQMGGPQDSYQNQMYRNQQQPPMAPSVQQPSTGPFHQQQQQQQNLQPPPASHSQSYSSGQMYPPNNANTMPMGPGTNGPHHQPPSNMHPPSGRLFSLHLFNLPPNVRSVDLINNFFAPQLYPLEENIQIFYDAQGRPTGMAMVSFQTAREFDIALALNGRYLFDKPIQIRPIDDPINSGSGSGAPPPHPPPSTHSDPYMDPNYPPGYRTSPGPAPDLPYTNNRGPPPMNSGGPPFAGCPPPRQQQGPNKELVVYMKGLPFSNCTHKDVEEFFQPIPLANIEIERDPRGKPSGNAFVEFENRIDYERGMEYNMRHMGRRYIELIPLLKVEKYGPRGVPPGGERSRPPQTWCISVKGLSPSVTSQDLKQYFGNCGARPFAVHIMLTPNQMNAGEAFLEFSDKESHKRALKLDGDLMGPDQLTVRHVPYDIVIGAIQGPPPGHGPMVGAPKDFFREGGKGGSRARGPPMPLPFQDKSAILIALDCSSKAQEEDFCVFFEKFKITPDRIKLQLNQHGTINAQISFLSRLDAEAALRGMHGKFFLGRNIHLEYL